MNQELRPTVVVVAAVVSNNQILLIKRTGGNLIGWWALPGGKVETREHVSEAAVREISEETGLQTIFKKHLGFVSEHLVEAGNIFAHIALHVCLLIPQTREGKLRWFNFTELENSKDSIIPSDYYIIEKMIKNRPGDYFNSVIEKNQDSRNLLKFDSI